MKKTYLLLFVIAIFSLPAAADGIPLSVQTAYAFNCTGGGHEDGCDSGLVKILNVGGGNLSIDHVVLSGWSTIFHFQDDSYGHVNQDIVIGGPVNISDSYIFNSGLTKDPRWGFDLPAPGALFDSSNYGALKDATKGIVITVVGSYDQNSFAWTFYDNQTYAITFGCHGTTGGLEDNDCDDLNPQGGQDFGPTSFASVEPVPEPSSILLIGTGVVGMLSRRKRWF